MYRINIYALVRPATEGEDKADLESKELHAKLVLNESLRLEVYSEEQHPSPK